MEGIQAVTVAVSVVTNKQTVTETFELGDGELFDEDFIVEMETALRKFLERQQYRLSGR